MTGNGKLSKITKDFLKREKNEFDIGCIYDLSLKSLGIFDLGCIGECSQLVILDLSYNNISNTRSLATLKQLQILRLSNNRLSDLNGLEELDSLYSLDVAGNFLNSVHTLYPLKNLGEFRSLRLIDSVKCLSNPVCQNNSNYKEEVFGLLVELKILDGELITGKGSEFTEFCEKLNVSLKEREAEVSRRRIISYERSKTYPSINIDEIDSKLTKTMTTVEERALKLVEDCEKANGKACQAIAIAEQRIKFS